MQHLKWIAVAGAWLCVQAAAQTPPGAAEQPGPADGTSSTYKFTERSLAESPPLQKEYKARYIQRQLDLSPQQREQYEAYVASILLGPPPPLNLEMVQEIYAKWQAADEAGDQAEADEYRAQLAELGEQFTNEPAFYDNIRLMLSDEQIVLLDKALERLKHQPSGGVRPVDVLDFVDGLDLTDEQRARVAEVKDDLRGAVTRSRTFDPRRKVRLMESLFKGLRAVLSEQQLSALETHVDKLRPDRVPGIQQMDRAYESRRQQHAPVPAGAAEGR